MVGKRKKYGYRQRRGEHGNKRKGRKYRDRMG